MLGTPNRDRVTERREASQREIVGAAWEVARAQGLSQVTLRDIATRVGMQAPSLYSHFPSKNAIYDAMFAEAWSSCLRQMRGVPDRLPPRARLRAYLRSFFDFAVGDLARHQLMNQRTIPGFEPSAQAYAPAVEVLAQFRERLADMGVTADEDMDLCVAMVGGLIDAQLANDPGGDRWARLLDRATDMFADNVGIPPDLNPEERT